MKHILTAFFAGSLFLFSCGQQEQGSSDNNAKQAPPTGKELFSANCQMCHGLNTDKTGPNLAGVLGRWKNDTTRLTAYIKNAKQVIDEGKDPYVAELHKKWNGTMPPFPALDDAAVKQIIDYVGKGVE